MTPRPSPPPKVNDTSFIDKHIPINDSPVDQPIVPAIKKASGKGDIAMRLDQLRPVKQRGHEVEMWSRVGVGRRYF